MRDQKTENYLQRGLYKFRYEPHFKLSNIDFVRAANNPARLGRRLDDDRVMAMWWEMEQGVEFPAIVVFQKPDGTFDLVTGMHRGSAAKLANKDELDAYVVDEPDEYRAALLPRAINVLEGVRPSLSENLAQIAEILRLYPDALQSDLAVAFSVKPVAISEYLRLQSYEVRAEHLGCSEYWLKLTQGARLRLGRLSNDNVFAAAVETIARTKTNGKPAEELIASLKKARTEAMALGLLASAMKHYEEELRKAKGKFGRQRPAVYSNWIARLRSLWRFLPVWNVATLHLDAMPEEELNPNIEIIEETITQLEDALADLKALAEKRRHTPSLKDAA